MELNYVAIVIATVLQFIVGAVWYMPIFGKVWGTIHGFDRLAPEEQTNAQKGMGPYLVLQFVVTLVTTYVLALFVSELSSEWHAFGAAGFLWLGFVAPTQASAVMFGGTPKEWMCKKFAIMASGSLVNLMVAAATLSYL